MTRAKVDLQDSGELDPQFRIATPEGDYWVAMRSLRKRKSGPLNAVDFNLHGVEAFDGLRLGDGIDRAGCRLCGWSDAPGVHRGLVAHWPLAAQIWACGMARKQERRRRCAGTIAVKIGDRHRAARDVSVKAPREDPPVT